MDKVTDKQHKKHIAQILETIELGCSGIVGDSDVAALKYILDLSAKQAKTIEELGKKFTQYFDLSIVQTERIKELEETKIVASSGCVLNDINVCDRNKLQAEITKLKEQIKLLSKRPDFSKPGHDVDKFYKFYKD